MSEKPNQHSQEEHCVGHEDAGSIDKANVCMNGCAGICERAIRRSDLASV